MTVEEIMIWLTQLGTDWVPLHKAHEAYGEKLITPSTKGRFPFTDWREAGYIQRKDNTKLSPFNIEYRLTQRAIDRLKQ